MRPDRYGSNSDDENKDHFFEDEILDDNSNSSLAESLIESENSSSKADGSREANSTNSIRNQVSRIEAKLDSFQDILKQIQLTVISFSNGVSKASQNLLPKLPLTTEESVNKFETDLNDISYRKAIVSIFLSLLYTENILYYERIRFLFFRLIIYAP